MEAAYDRSCPGTSFGSNGAVAWHPGRLSSLSDIMKSFRAKEFMQIAKGAGLSDVFLRFDRALPNDQVTGLEIIQRCENPNHKQFKDWGGRGISIYPPWRKSAEKFISYVLKHLGARPPGKTIDRIDNDRRLCT